MGALYRIDKVFYIKFPIQLAAVFHSNIIIENTGTILYFKDWPLIEIFSCTIINNIAQDYCILINLGNDKSPSKISVGHLALVGNRVLQKSKAAIIDIRFGKADMPVLFNLIFVKNIGTPLALNSVSVKVAGNLTFVGNIAVTGGGLYIDRSVLYLADNATMYFTNNYAMYGGAVYIEATQTGCFVNSKYKHSIVLTRNTATVGSSIFYASKNCKYTCRHMDDITVLPTFGIMQCFQDKILLTI